MTTTTQWIGEIRDAMQAVDGLNMTEAHRQTIFRCLESALVDASARHDKYEETERDGKRWTDDEIKILREVLTGRVAKTWDAERLNVMEASLRLRRNERTTKKKAIELGLGRAVDYWSNREDQ